MKRIFGALTDSLDCIFWPAVSRRLLSDGMTKRVNFGHCSVYGKESFIAAFNSAEKFLESTDRQNLNQIKETNFVILDPRGSESYSRANNLKFSIVDDVGKMKVQDVVANWIFLRCFADEIKKRSFWERRFVRSDPKHSVAIALRHFEDIEYTGYLSLRLKNYLKTKNI